MTDRADSVEKSDVILALRWPEGGLTPGMIEVYLPDGRILCREPREAAWRDPRMVVRDIERRRRQIELGHDPHGRRIITVDEAFEGVVERVEQPA